MSEFEKYRATLPLHQMLVSANCCKHAFEHQQAIINDLKAQLECCRRENAVLLGKVGELQGQIENMEQCYIEKKKQVEDALHILDELYRKGLFAKPKALSEAISVLRGAND